MAVCLSRRLASFSLLLICLGSAAAADGASTPANVDDMPSWCVFAAVIAVVAQAAVIALLVLQVRRRREAERRLAEINARLADDIAENSAALRRNEDLYREVVENARSIILRWGADGRILFINDFSLEFLGWQPDELVGRQVLGTILPAAEASERGLCQLTEEIRRNHARYRLTVTENQRRDGARIWMAWSHRPVFGAKGELVEVFSVGTDITERKRLETELTAAKERAEAGDRAKMLFLATMSHEIRTPMNGVLGLTELLLAGELAPAQRDLALSLYRSGEALLAILDEILDYSKLEAGRVQLESIPFDPGSAVRDVAELFRGRLAAEVSLSVAAPPTAAPRLGDPARVRQVLNNLVGNAVKFTLAGTVTVSLEEAPGRVILAVADTGPGIPASDQEGLFRPFTQADPGVNRRHGGTGLGLAICKRLVELMRGSIRLASEPGVGTTVTVELPLPVSSERPAPEHRRVISPAPRRPAGRCRVLLVEDNPVNQAVARGMLEHLGALVAVASDGCAASSLAAQEDFDLVLMDLHLPDMDGCEATQRIRALRGRRARVPVVALTASALPEDRSRCLAAGMDGHLAKPVTLAELARQLERWLVLPATPAADASLIDPAAALDPRQLAELEQVMGGRSGLCSLLADFRRDAARLGRTAAAAAAAGDRQSLERAAHQLKGAAGTAGAGQVQAAAAGVVAAARGSGDLAAPSARLAAELQRLDTALAGYLASGGDQR